MQYVSLTYKADGQSPLGQVTRGSEEAE